MTNSDSDQADICSNPGSEHPDRTHDQDPGWTRPDDDEITSRVAKASLEILKQASKILVPPTL